MPEASAKYCLTCGYVLDYLPQPRCPECGRGFDPVDPATYATAGGGRIARVARFIGRQATAVWGALPLMWGLLVSPAASPLTVPVLLGGVVVNLRRRRWWSTGAIVLLSPFAVVSYTAAWDYLDGSGCLRGMGLFSLEHYNIDPQYRCPRRTGGCVVRGGEWVRIGPYNLTLKLLITVCGPMRGSYVGPYPMRADCQAALATPTDITPQELASDRVVLGADTCTLDPGVGRRLLGITWQMVLDGSYPLDEALRELGPLQAARWHGCLILRIPEDPVYDSTTKPFIMVAIDPNTGRPFAYFSEGASVLRPPRVLWRK